IARTGETVSRSSKSIVYTGYQWRGRGGSGDAVWREVLTVDRGWNEMSGRWFTGPYDETGIDVKLVRMTGAPVVFGTSASGLRTGAGTQAMKIFGTSLPASIKPEDIGLGQGVKVTRIVSATPEEIAVEVDVAATAPIGVRDLSVAGTNKPAALA